MDAAKELGMEVVQAWRNSLKARPPMMKEEDEWYPGKDRRYEDLTKEQIPLTESLMDCMERGERLIHINTFSMSNDNNLPSYILLHVAFSSASLGVCNQERD